MPVTPVNEMAPITSNMSSQSLVAELDSSPVDFDFSDIGFFENITGLEGPAVDGEIDMTEIDDMFRSIQAAGSSLLEPMMELGQSKLQSWIVWLGLKVSKITIVFSSIIVVAVDM